MDKLLGLVLGACASLSVCATPLVVIDAVQAPAWVERHEVRRPLAPGMVLENGDRLVTGEGARVVLRLANGSILQVGASAQLFLRDLVRASQGELSGTLVLVAGAVRVTAAASAVPHDLRLRLGDATASFRQGDLWARRDGACDLLMLLAGRVEVAHVHAVLELGEAHRLWQVVAGGVPELAMADAGQAAAWTAETDLRGDAATQRQGGNRALRLASADSQAQAMLAYDAGRAAGYATRIKQRLLHGITRYEVLIEQLVSLEDAQRLAVRLVAELQLGRPVVCL